MNKALTKRQNEVLEFIKEYTSKNFKPPTIREICKKFNIKSTNTVYLILKALEKKGYIKRANFKARNITIDNLKLDDKQGDLKQIPIISNFNVRNPIAMFSNLNGTLKIDSSLLEHPPSFAIEVPDDGMRKDGIFKGDIAVITQKSNLKNGSIIFAIVEDKGLIRYVRNENGEIYLIPSSRGYEILKFKENDENLWIGGEVSLIIRKLTG